MESRALHFFNGNSSSKYLMKEHQRLEYEQIIALYKCVTNRTEFKHPIYVHNPHSQSYDMHKQ